MLEALVIVLGICTSVGITVLGVFGITRAVQTERTKRFLANEATTRQSMGDSMLIEQKKLEIMSEHPELLSGGKLELTAGETVMLERKQRVDNLTVIPPQSRQAPPFNPGSGGGGDSPRYR